jgi:hypothetical protein
MCIYMYTVMYVRCVVEVCRYVGVYVYICLCEFVLGHMCYVDMCDMNVDVLYL